MVDKSKWKKEGKDWEDAVLLKVDVDPEDASERLGGHAGSYHPPTKVIQISDPKKLYPSMQEEALTARHIKESTRNPEGVRGLIRDIVRERNLDLKTSSLSHELAHWQLGHSSKQEDKEARVRGKALSWFGTSDWSEVEKDFGEGYVNALESFEDLVTEFEVRLFQEAKEWFIGGTENIEKDTFMGFFTKELGGKGEFSRVGAVTINMKRLVFEAATRL